MEQVLEKLQLIFDKIGNLDSRMSGVEEKLQKKSKPKTKGARDISQVHIFPFDETDEFVKMAIIDENKKNKDCYPVVEFLQMDFTKLGNLMIHSDILSVQWSDFTPAKSVAKFENNQYVLCN